MPISLQPSHKAQLHVELGKTSLQELEKFSQELADKGGGEVRAKKNKDGSYTLYVAANTKVRLSRLSQEWGKTERAAKKDLARDLMSEILSRSIPGGKPEIAKGILGSLTNHSNGLKAALEKTGKEVFASMPESEKQKFSSVAGVMSQPETREAFGRHLKSEFADENYAFLRLVQDYGKVSDPHAKLRMAEKIFKMIESPENPSVQEVPVRVGGQVQINISAPTANRAHEEMQLLRQHIVAGQQPTPAVRQMLDHLFDGAKGNILQAVEHGNLRAFVLTDAFKVAVGLAFARTSGESRDTSAAGRLAPGSGLEFQSKVAQTKQHLAHLQNLLAHPEALAGFREHLGQLGKARLLQNYEGIVSLQQLSGQQAIPDSHLLKGISQILEIPWETIEPSKDPSPLGKSQVEGLEDDSPPPLKEELTHFAKKLRELNEELREMNNLFGEGGSQDEGGSEVLIRSKIQSFLQELRLDALNGLRTNNLHGYPTSSPFNNLIERQVSDAMFDRQMHWQPDQEQHFGSFERFSGKPLEGSGGATGSGRTKVGGQLYQVKGSIKHAGLGRQFKARGLNTENYGEVIASNLARSLVRPSERGHVPEVSLRQNSSQHEAVVTSRYLAGGKGDLKALYLERAGQLPRGQKHPRIQLDSMEPSGGGILRLDAVASQDVRRNIALSSLLGDHDVNPGNMIALKDGHVGRIDFGHAFNELITGIGGKLTGGGGVRHPNRILDFFNREKVSGLPLTGQTKSKLWRDYIGPGPSTGTTEALRSVADSQEWVLGLAQAKTQFLDLVTSLSQEGTEAAQTQIQDITDSLKQMSANMGKPVDAQDPGDVIRIVFENLHSFVSTGQEQMRTVADLSELQTQIDECIRRGDEGLTQSMIDSFNRLKVTDLGNGDNGITWMKQSAGTPAFSGTLVAYYLNRQQELAKQV